MLNHTSTRRFRIKIKLRTYGACLQIYFCPVYRHLIRMNIHVRHIYPMAIRINGTQSHS